MAIAVVGSAQGQGSGTGFTDTTTYTVTAGSSVLLIATNSNAAGSLNSISYSLGGSFTRDFTQSANGIDWWRLANPASGLATITFNHDNNAQIAWGIIEISGSATGALAQNVTDTNTTTNPSTNITPNATPGLILSGIWNQSQANNGYTTDAGQTEFCKQGNPTRWLSASYKSYTGLSAVTMSYTGGTAGNTWDHSLVQLNQAAATLSAKKLLLGVGV